MKKTNSLFIDGLSREELRSDLREQLRITIREELELRKKAPPDSNINLLTLEETAEIFKVSRRTLFNWSQNKIIIPITIGRRVYFRVQAIEKLLEMNEIKEQIK